MIQLDDLLCALAPGGGRLAGTAGARAFSGFAHDSRTVAPGELFVALRTDKADGHDFIGEAIAAGAAGVLCERLPAEPSAITTITVSDMRAALSAWAKHALHRVAPVARIAVAGASGKSSTCGALLRALGTAGVFSNGDRNDELGLPLALGGLRSDQHLAVLEIAAHSSAELARLAALVSPFLLLLTNASPGAETDAAGIALREGLPALLAALDPSGSLLVNGDDAELSAQIERRTLPARTRVLRYGLGERAELRGEVLHESRAGATIAAHYGSQAVRLALHAPGRGVVYAALAALAGAVALGRGLAQAAAKLDGLTALPGRLAPLQGADGRSLLDDSVSATPSSLALALRTLALFPRPHVAVVGAVSGVTSAAALSATTLTHLLALDRLVLQGRELASLGRELRNRSPHPERIVLAYSPRDSADAALAPQGARADKNSGTVLVKGSDASRMERVVALLLDEQEREHASLLRQDSGWQRRTYLPSERPTWVEVDLDAIRANLGVLQRAAAPAEVMAVLKADAYGHGARWVARTASLNGAAMLGVASLNEALDLRADGINTPILILGYAPPWQARELALSGIRVALFSLPVAEHFSRIAHDLGLQIGVHIKIDTGMTRLGVLPADAPAFVDRVAALPGLHCEGIFTHLATSDSDVPFALEQGERFAMLLSQLSQAGHTFQYIHVENSAATLRRLPFAHNLVRLGLALYGLYPLPAHETEAVLRPALSFKTRVAQVKEVPAGTGVSYGRSFVTQRPSRIAVLPVGYGDGFRRSPRSWGEVLVRGRRAPITGNVNMDMTMIDVTDIDGVREGDEVVLIGRQGDDRLTADEVAARLGTIAYEVVTQILPRVPRLPR